ncbi:low molecular weight protein-tyrosine-phosphatase [Pseudomonas fluorescens]|uniref:low molecular weight protein-tyrosine-phosphatase n=1 Tax=Pseudomonas fluorescens TaxID=294 RepID=UPI0017838F47|nr:low molecular weight protein-tyrosine-phosphatase [Pseudomonas fluorescens]
MFKRILIVCIGNICRSPTAVTLLREAMAGTGIEIDSAGLAAVKDHPMDMLAKAVLEEHGHIPIGHSGRQLTKEIVAESDLILVMEKRHLDGVFSISPEARGKVFLLGKWQNDREIADPYRQGKPAFVHTYALINEASHAWALRFAR